MSDRVVSIRLEATNSQYDQAMRRSGAATAALGGQVARTQADVHRTMTQIGVAGVALGGALAYGLKQTVDASISFESAFAGVRKTVDASEQEFAAMSAGIRDMAKDIPVTVEEIAGIGETAGQLGIAKESILDFSRTMADLGVATNMSSEEAATSLARLANITQMPQDEFDRLGSTVVDLGNNLATTEGEIVEMGLRLAGAGSQVGMTEAQILGLAGALSSVGIRAEAGGSAISKVMIEIASEVENGGDKLETFARVAGMSAEQFSTAYREDATEAIIRFIEGLGDMEAQGGSTLGVLEELGIEEVRMRDALLRTSGAGDQLREAIERGTQAWKENVALTVEAEQRYGTTESQLKMASNRINDMKIALGDVLAPTMLDAANTAAGLAESIASLSPSAQNAIAKIGLVTSGVALLGGAALIAIPRIAAMNATLAATGPIGLATSRVLAGMTGAVFGPWGMAAAGLTATALGLGRAFTEAREQAKAMAQEIMVSSASTEEATRRLGDALDDHTGKAFSAGTAMSRLGNALLGPIGAYRNLRDEIFRGSAGWTLWRTEVQAMPEAMGRATYAATEFTPAAGRSAEVTDQMGAASAGASTDIDSMTGAVTQSKSAFDSLAPSVMAAFQALGTGFTPQVADATRETVERGRALNEKIAENNRRAAEQRVDAEKSRDKAIRDAHESHRDAVLTAEERFSDQVADATRKRNEALMDLERDAAEARRDLIEDRTQEIFGELDLGIDPKNSQTSSIEAVTRSIGRQTDQLAEWLRGLETLRSRGVGDQTLSALGLDEFSREALLAVRNFTGATDDELAGLNDIVARRFKLAGDQAHSEAERLVGALGDSLRELARENQEKAAEIHANHAAAMVDANADLSSAMAEASANLGEALSSAQTQFSEAVEELTSELARKNQAERESALSTAQMNTDMEASFDSYMQAMDEQIAAQQKWHDDLNTIREAAGDEYADMLAAQGPAQAALHAEIAAQSEEEIRAAADRALTLRQDATDEAIAQLLRSEPEWVDAAGHVSEETVAEIAEKLGMTKDAVRAAIDRSVPALEAAMGSLATTAGIEAAKVVGAMIGEFNLAPAQISQITADWATALEQGIAPMIRIVEGIPTVSADDLTTRRLLSGGGLKTRAMGGSVMPGDPYLVGEGGPELVTFGSSGMVHPADETQRMLAALSSPMTAATTTGGMSRGGVDRSMHTGDIKVYYPKPEPASDGIPRALERTAFLWGAH